MTKISTLERGLVGHWKLADKFQKVGSELVTNGDFANWTGDNPDDWTLIGTEDANNYVTEDSSKCRIVSDGTDIGILQTILTIGQIYYYSVDVVTATTGRLNFSDGVASLAQLDTVQTYAGTFIAQGTQLKIRRFQPAESADIVIDNVIIKPLKVADLTPQGNHCVNHGVTFTTDRNSVANMAGVFDRSDPNYLIAPISLSSGLYSVALWVKKTYDSVQYVLDFRDSGGTGYFYLKDDDTVSVPVGSGVVYVDAVQTTALSRDVWHHVVVTELSVECLTQMSIGIYNTLSTFPL